MTEDWRIKNKHFHGGSKLPPYAAGVIDYRISGNAQGHFSGDHTGSPLLSIQSVIGGAYPKFRITHYEFRIVCGTLRTAFPTISPLNFAFSHRRVHTVHFAVDAVQAHKLLVSALLGDAVLG